ncbi:methyl-CpG-binding domain-containing protein 2 [Forsythia ovata]|uniref:Methyl-CpG-binding domain-containing protein 2 n=1 Tax=Forsythia ovata TaxID=205694 RepID=A0ABD1U9Q5_9LAMI
MEAKQKSWAYVGDEENQPENAQNQLVLYDPAVANSARGIGIEAVPDSIAHQPPSFSRFPFSNQTSRVLPSVGAFTVQCANCFKWRLIPSKAKYEEIREYITEQLFLCVTAREWRSDVSCDDPPDIIESEFLQGPKDVAIHRVEEGGESRSKAAEQSVHGGLDSWVPKKP